MENSAEEEIWKDIPGYEGYYQVSDLGRIKSLSRKRVENQVKSPTRREKILKSGVDGIGYLNYKICIQGKNKTFTGHKLVAMAFLGHVPDGTHKVVVDHINNIKTDNRLSNLQLITQRENMSKDRKSVSKYTGVFFSKTKLKWETKLHINKKSVYLGVFEYENIAAEMYKKALKYINLYKGNAKEFREKLKNEE